jgi:hypothetical protein
MRLSVPEQFTQRPQSFLQSPMPEKLRPENPGDVVWVGIIRRLEVRARLVHIFFSDKPPENSDDAENSEESSSSRDIDILATKVRI